MNTKLCPQCRQEKPFEDFGKSKSEKFGLDIYCKVCRVEMRKENSIIACSNRTSKLLAQRERQLNKYLDSIGMSREEYDGQSVQTQEKINSRAVKGL